MKIETGNFTTHIAEQLPKTAFKEVAVSNPVSKASVIPIYQTNGQNLSTQAKSGGTQSSSSNQKATFSVNEQSLDEAIADLNQSTQNIQRSLEFSIDDDVGKTIITVKDKNTDEVVRQIPAEEIIEISKRIQEFSQKNAIGLGFLFEEQA